MDWRDSAQKHPDDRGYTTEYFYEKDLHAKGDDPFELKKVKFLKRGNKKQVVKKGG